MSDALNMPNEPSLLHRLRSGDLRGPHRAVQLKAEHLSNGWCLRWLLRPRPFGPAAMSPEAVHKVQAAFWHRATSMWDQTLVEVDWRPVIGGIRNISIVLSVTGDAEYPTLDEQRSAAQLLSDVLNDTYVKGFR